QAPADVEHDAQADHDADARREELAEWIRRVARDAEADPHEGAEEQRDREHADEAPFLTDRREDEIGIRVRKIAELLLTLSKADTEQPPCPDARQRLLHLPRRFRRRRARIQ